MQRANSARRERATLPAVPTSRLIAGVVDEEEARAFYEMIDADGNGSVSKLELVDAVYRDPRISTFVLRTLGGEGSSVPMSDEQSFDVVDAIFNTMAGGRQRISYPDFIAQIQRAASERAVNTQEMRAIYRLLDASGNGSISKLELLGAMLRDPVVADFLVPGMDRSRIMSDENCFDTVSTIFEAITGGKRRIDYADFERYFRKTAKGGARPRPPLRTPATRGGRRVLIIGPGFDLNLRQGAAIEQAGFDVRWCHDLPDPGHLAPPAAPLLGRLRAAIGDAQPDVLVCASAGGAYVVAMWALGFWRGPTVVLNAHPSMKRLPIGVPIVLAHGANDDVYPRSRAELEALVSTGSENKCFLYYTGNSGQIAPGAYTRVGDRHQMDSLLLHDCLPQLVDAVLSPEGPEAHVVRSWRERLSDERLEAEHWLGYTTERLRHCWVSPGRRGADHRQLFEVPRGSEEFRRVATILRASPREASDYELAPQASWERATVTRVERVENGQQEAGSARPYCEAMRKAFQAQGLAFEPGVHTCWAFHGAGGDASAIESIVSNPAAGFQPLSSGLRNKPLWGPGAYFARDAQYVSDGHFCGPPAADGTRQMLLCLLTLGMPCVGDPLHTGVLPHRRKPHRYNSSVDSMSGPEIYALQHPGAAYPAYLITFI